MQVRKLRWLCRFPVMLNSGGHIAEGHVIDLSMSGCAIETSDSLLHSQYMNLHIIIPEDGIRIDVGKVRWCNGRRFGVEFLKIADRQGDEFSSNVFFSFT
jgi:hypothetical protein